MKCTIRFSGRLKRWITADSERCGRNFEAQVIAILRKHYGADVNLTPAPEQMLTHARGSSAGLSTAEDD